MRLLPSTRALVASGSALALAFSLSTPASAQVTNEPDPPEQLEGEVELESGQDADCQPGDTRAECQTDEAITVTGSRIRRPNLESNQPITSVGVQELTDTGDVSIGDALNDLPSIRSTFSQGNSTRFIGTAGLNVLDLRGLGTSRTLVLQNGRRLPAATPGSNLVDVNIIPTDLIERVDVVTGGNSAIYGSDAVAGVVNFVLRRDYDGIRVRGQAGVSEEGDRATYFVSGIFGHNFGDGRGNITLNAEYVRQNSLLFTDRANLTGAFAGRCQFNLAEPTTGEPPEGDGVPDNQFFCGVRNVAIADTGAVSAPSPVIGGVAVACSDPRLGPGGTSAALGAQRCINPGTPTGALRFLIFNPGGDLVEQTPSFDFRPFGSGNAIGQQGSTLRGTGQLAPQLDRYTVGGMARFEISPALVPFIEATYVHLDAVGEGQASFFQGTFPSFFGFFSVPQAPRGIRCDNPFLDAADIARLQTIGRCAGGAASTETVPLGRFNTDFGGRQDSLSRNLYRIVGGLEGEFNGDWRYELSANYGRYEQQNEAQANLLLFTPNGDPGGFLAAIDVIRDPATNQIVCRDPAARAAGCVPINPFGSNPLTQAQRDFIFHTSTSEEWNTLFQVLGFVSGDTSQFLNLPGGPIGFALGAEYRRTDAFRAYDEVTASGLTFFNAIQPFEPPAQEVREAFGEIRLPLLRDLPFARELTIEAAARVSDYNTRVGTVWAYNVGGTWAPISDLRFRGNYSTSVRAPTLIDLYAPLGQNFAFVNDPCDVLYIGTNPNFAANCAAAGVPAGFINTIARSQTIDYRAGGNELLEEERGRSFTVGGVFTPSFLPGFSFTADYYDITVENLIATLGPQQILNLCYGSSAGIQNQYCALIQRDPGGLITPGFPISGGVNFARQETAGIDLEVAYRRTFGNGHRLSARAIATHVLQLTNFTDPVTPTFGDRQLSELGDPAWAFNVNVNYDMGALDIGYNMRYLGVQTICAYEAQHSFEGRPATNADCTQEVNYPAVFYHNIRIGYEVTERFAFYGGIDNLTDLEPPFGLLGTAGGDPYDTYGRFFYFGARVDF